MSKYGQFCVISLLSAALLLSACSRTSNGDEFIGYWAPAKNSPIQFARTEITKNNHKFTIIEDKSDRFPASYDPKNNTLTIFAPLYGNVTFSYNSSTDQLSAMGAILKRTHPPTPIATRSGVEAAQAEKPSPFDRPSCSNTVGNGGSRSGGGADVRGVRVGMSLDAAVLHLECLDPSRSVARETKTDTIQMNYYGHKIRTHVDIAVGTPRSAQELAHGSGYYSPDPGVVRFMYDWGLKHVDASYHLLAFGNEGSERVYAVEQERKFDTGSQPTVANVESSLIAKYGAPSKRDEQNFEHILVWVHGPSGQLVGEGNPLVNTCAYEGSVDTGEWRGDCGLSVVAQVGWRQQNPLLATDLSVGLVNQGSLVRETMLMSAAWKAANEAEQREQAAKAAKIKTKL
jgi:hypothetical protein